MEHSSTKAKILAGGAMLAKMRRMAYQVYEKNFDQKEITLIGVGLKGLAMAKILAKFMVEISPIHVQLLEIHNDGTGSFAFGNADAVKLIQGKHVLIVDDVLYSGNTMFQALAATMAYRPYRVEMAILIDRGHHLVPISPNYVGMVLGTTLLQYVAVEFEEDHSRASAYLY